MLKAIHISRPLLPVIRSGFSLTGVLCLLLIASGLTECVWGVLQLLDVVGSGHPRYPVTGSFYNPGPYGCFIGCLLPLAVWLYSSNRSNRYARALAAGYILLCALLMPGGMSRTGWLAAAAGTAVVLLGVNRDAIRRLGLKKILLIASAVCIVAAAALAGAYMLKPDSADGRLLLWKIAASALTGHPVAGVGWEYVAGAYGHAQEAYFASGNASPRDAMLAGTPAYVFNEYLQIGIAYGVPAMLLFAASLVTAAVIYLRNRHYGLAGVTVALIVVCFASYPLQFLVFRVLIGLVVAVSLLLSRNALLRTALFIPFVLAWTCACADMRAVDINPGFHHAQRMQQLRRYESSNSELQTILRKSSDPMPLNLMGLNYQAMQMRDSAEYCFHRAALRVPHRLYPHFLLMRLYAQSPADTALMIKEADILLTKQPKTHSPAIEQMRREARQILSKHNLPMKQKLDRE